MAERGKHQLGHLWFAPAASSAPPGAASVPLPFHSPPSLDSSRSPTRVPGRPPPPEERRALTRVLVRSRSLGGGPARQPQLQEAQQLVSNGARAGANPLSQPNPLMALPPLPHSPLPQCPNIHGNGTKGCPAGHPHRRAATSPLTALLPLERAAPPPFFCFAEWTALLPSWD